MPPVIPHLVKHRTTPCTLCRTARRFRPAALLGLLPLLAAGCNIIGAAAAKAPRPDIAAVYNGLAHHSVGVVVWADRSLVTDWPTIQLDIANSIMTKLKVAQEAKSKELEGTTFPYPAASFVKYQKEHPGLEALPITEVAPRFGVDRVIYIEVNDFSTRADGAVALYLGKIDVAMKILEVDKGKSKSVYDEASIKSQFPDKATKEGVLNSSDRAMYGGTINAVTTDIVTRLIQHPDDSP